MGYEKLSWERHIPPVSPSRIRRPIFQLVSLKGVIGTDQIVYFLGAVAYVQGLECGLGGICNGKIAVSTGAAKL
jgi:hypothetical protein